MAWIRQLPSGLWAATVRLPDGKRVLETHRLKGAVSTWAADLEADIRRGDWIDPRAGKKTVGECWEQWGTTSRRLEKASRKRDESHWRVHVAPRWAKTPVGTILRPDVTAWVVEMEGTHKASCRKRDVCSGCKPEVGAATIEGAVGVLRAILDLAVEARLIRDNPARGVRKPKRNAHVDRVLEPSEEKQLVDALDRMFPGRLDAGLFVELIADTGLRWEEAAAIPPQLIDTRKNRIQIAWVMERDGTARPYAKSAAGNRTVTYGDHLAKRVKAAKMAAGEVAGVFPNDEPGRLVFTSEKGDQLRYSNWHRRVWTPALRGLPERPMVKGHAHRPAVAGAGLADPQPTPHDLRHTYGTGLADQGVPVHDIMALMGHEDLRSAQRYLHSREERFERARAARSRSRAAGS
ncbi:site-specific integrase [Micromonospora chalcea]|uniref:tyrosine-type recombinase/integrase n=1 Tax=Micromonospora chalcea TaxID=1874 RepID=UPI0021A4D060|nr:site-specific integrase [Micromonospora chalcea]MCT2281793.1 site-specific integrase [Micromonospora chalcea]